ncbi:Arylsulfatase precursor [Rosistilla carotiformis]|uniref:Arylsulfatase n=1 Tax=Rosistilla carotiformis TaxID=2528017 RepID=A0A518JTB2_9BACT|nr:sulfatase [Rosistilla carotiformis]QDV68782.1 Arylsulfatase precursor [Rosistilla carotiformis]
MRNTSRNLVLLFAPLAVAMTFAPDAVAADRPNIVVFLVDDMGIMDTSVPFLTDEQGEPKRYPLNDFYRTPNMQRLAQQGIRFNQFYAMSVCSPTRISIMTGQNAARHRATNWINPQKNNAGPHGAPDWNWIGLTPQDVTLPGILRSQGYKTMHIGKGHFGAAGHPGSEPLNLGFEINVAGAAFGAPGSYYGEKDYGQQTRRKHHAVPHLEKYHGTQTFLTEALTLEANALVKQAAKQEEPFYLYFAHYAVHAPFDSDPRFAANYKDSGKPENAQAFATLIEGMDKSLGDLLDQLEALGIAEETLVFFLGDNGSDAPLGDQHEVACAAPLRGKKGAHYEGGMRVPFIAAWAKPDASRPMQQRLQIPAGKIQSQVAAVQDLFPTILDVANASGPERHIVDGLPLQTLLTGKPDPQRKEQFLMHYPHGPHRSNYFTSWRDGDWKVVYHTLPDEKTTGGFIQFDDGHFQLFNLASDPFESTNLAQSHPQELKHMMQGLIAQLAAHDALYPVDDAGNALRPQLP